MACAYHIQIIVAVTAGNGFIADGLKCTHSCEFGMLHSHLKIRDRAVRCHFQAVAQKGGVAQLLHQRHGKFLKGIAEDDYLGKGAELIKKFLCARQRING